ncbi:hypothetical protein SAMN05421829_111176 [Aromatoleum tolulyticum]|uniref:Tli3-like domain-containing protein n=1 Tax=Aromatoleum tolulyticum TaxID=34027 RepID=A0A1N6ZAT9_9RHOO|nr:hypothetical protein [Aromatoleum tolulyticum]SIR23944.1 hypothetical protein SAMN05421829_111176 [Aromatoleum tolulyticum]
MKVLLPAALAALATLSGCGTIASIATGAGAMPLNEIPRYDGPRQVIYRIDQYRYITTEAYQHCDRHGYLYWHDDRKNQHVKLGWTAPWFGRYVIEPGEDRIAIPNFGCEDKGCYLTIDFSNDGGKTWDVFSSERFGGSHWGLRDKTAGKEIEATEVRVTAEGLIYVIASHRHHYSRYRLDGTPDQRPRGTSLSDRKDGVFNWEDVASVPNVKTPSGQDRFTCDTSLNPPPRKDEE